MRSRAVVVGAVCAAAVVTGGWLVQRGLNGPVSVHAGSRLFDQVRQRIAENYVDEVDEEEMYKRAMTGLLLELDDPNSVYLSEERLSRLNERTSGTYGGLGVRFDVRDGWLTVIAAQPNSPAERGGLATGDRILAIDDSSTHQLTPDEAAGALRGTPGTKVRLLVVRGADGQHVNVTLERREIHVNAISRMAMLDGGVGYVDINTFRDSTTVELIRAVDSLRAAGAHGLVLDLRRNPGGLLQQGVEVADLFLDEGQKVLDVKGRTASSSATFTDQLPQRWSGMPMVVLVDDGTASAAEIVAGALQDHDRAVLIGRTTFGKGSAQSLFPLAGGGALKLTTARWYTPAGRAIGRPFGAELPPEDEQPLESAAPTRSREEFKTDGGRIVYGGGGITPDLVLGDTLLPPAEIVFGRALGNLVTTFRDIISDYALELRAARLVRSRAFEVTPTMRDVVFARLREHGVDVPREVYDGAAPLVDRLLTQEIARLVFDDETSVQRSVQWDRALQTAVGLLRDADSQESLIERAAGGAQVVAEARRAAAAPVSTSERGSARSSSGSSSTSEAHTLLPN